ncbi:MAG: YHYH protein [Pseudomonadota bacterium]
MLLSLFPVPAIAENQVSITKDNEYIYIKGNGLPDHKTGQFPNSRNPNAISEQNISFRVPLNPVKNPKSKPKRGAVGVALNGITFEPATAETWNGDRNYNYEAIDGSRVFGLDQNNAHVQPTGKYHYHGVPSAIAGKGINQIGYAADGFPIYSDTTGQYKSSYRLKSGQRPSGPGGQYDGTFSSDYEYVASLSVLDECNGATLDGQYVYFATETFPFLPRCLYGDPDPSFEQARGNRGGERRRPPHRGERQGRPPPRF